MTTLPGGPGRFESPVQLLKFLLAPYRFFADNQRRYGDFFRVHFPPPVGPVVFVGDPAAVREVFKKDQAGDMTIRDAGFLGAIFGERSIVVTVEGQHKQQRRVVTPPFHGEAMQACGKTVQDAALRATERWLRAGKMNTHEAMVELTLDATIPAVLGFDEPARVERFRHQARRTIAACRPELMFFQPLRRDLGRFSPWGRFLAEREAFHALVRAEAHARRQASLEGRTDLLSILLSARDETGAAMPEEEILEHVLTMVVLGHESTAAALAWGVYTLDREPAAARALRQELATVPPDADAGTLARLPYLSAVCKEILRLWPVVPEVRRRVLKEPWSVAGFQLPAGIYVAPCIYLVHRHATVYPDAEVFRPERFLERRFAGHEFLPFGGGTRSCVGGAFALYEMQILLGTLYARLDLRVADARPVRPVRQNLSVAPSGGVEVFVHPR